MNEARTGRESAIAEQLVELERTALSRWCHGDPSGFLEISDDEVTYFDPFLARRLDGLAALTSYYEALRGKIRAERFEILDPVVNAAGEMAVLSFNFVSFDARAKPMRWNCSEVYRRRPVGWRIVQTHWSLTDAGK